MNSNQRSGKTNNTGMEQLRESVAWIQKNELIRRRLHTTRFTSQHWRIIDDFIAEEVQDASNEDILEAVQALVIALKDEVSPMLDEEIRKTSSSRGGGTRLQVQMTRNTLSANVSAVEASLRAAREKK